METTTYITDFEALTDLVGKRVEVSPKFVLTYTPETIWESEEGHVERWKETSMPYTHPLGYRLRSRLGVTFDYETGAPIYLLSGRLYSRGAPTDRYENHYTIENQSSLKAAKLVVLDEV